MSEVIGLEARLYRNTGTFGVPVWNEIQNVQDVTVPLDKSEAEIKARGRTWTTHKQALKETSIEFGMLHDTLVDDFNVLRDAYLNNTVLDLLVLDGPVATSGSQGLRAECQIKSFPLNQPLEEALTENVVARPTPTANVQPVWFTAP